MLVLQARMGAQLADWNLAIPAAEECRRLATELGERQWVAAADSVDSIIAGTRGDEERLSGPRHRLSKSRCGAGRTSPPRSHNSVGFRPRLGPAGPTTPTP